MYSGYIRAKIYFFSKMSKLALFPLRIISFPSHFIRINRPIKSNAERKKVIKTAFLIITRNRLHLKCIKPNRRVSLDYGLKIARRLSLCPLENIANSTSFFLYWQKIIVFPFFQHKCSKILFLKKNIIV